MKNHLYYYNWQLQITISGTVMDDLTDRDFSKENIFFLSCNGCLKYCWSNPEGDPAMCRKCRFFKKASFEKIGSKVHQLYVDDYVDEAQLEQNFNGLPLDYQTVDDIKAIEYKGARIGYGALSTYFSKTRNREPVMDDAFRNYFNRLLRMAVMLTDAAEKVLAEVSPDTISIFNGRTCDVRPVFDLALKNEIPLRGIENIEYQSPFCRKDMYYNALPQDVDFHTRRIEELWQTSPLTDKEKENIASQFYEGRKGGKKVRDVKIYVKDQQRDLLPENWNPGKRNIVIFNSSEDEVAAIPEYDQRNLFHTQEEGLHYVFSNIKDDDIHFYLRVHPNLGEVPYGYHTRLYDLEEKYPNVTVIQANSEISTYKLMEEAEKVVVFGSTTGAESAYWRKPTLFLGISRFYYLNTGYTPKTKEEAIEMIKAKLDPKPKLGAIKFAYYLIDFIRFTTPIKLIPKEFKLFGRKLGYTHPHMTLMGSARLMKFMILVKYTWPEKLLRKLRPEKKSIIPRKGY